MHLPDLHFIRPLWLVAVLPAVLLLVLLWKSRASQAGWHGLIAPQLLQELMVGRDQGPARLPLILLACAWLLAALALAGPTWERQPQPVYRGSLDQVLVLDLSPSMARTDLQPDRVTRARFAISDLLAQSGEGRTALIVFGAEHHVVAPLTDDAPTVEQLLRALTVDVLPVPGDQAASALRASMQLLAAAKSRAMHVILISDGISDPADSIAAAIALRQGGAKLSVIGVGSEREPQLQELARSGGGVYRSIDSPAAHPALEVQAVADLAALQGREVETELWVEKGVWLILPLLLVAALGYRRGWLAVLVVVVCQQPQQAMAWDWNDLWLTPQQQAKRLFDEGQTREAAELFSDPDWRATAHYRSGEFDKAAADFGNSEAAYNRANALAKAGKLPEALESYDQALSVRPDDDDARFNRDLVRKLLDQQQQQEQQEESRKPGDSAESSQDEQSAGGQQQESTEQQDAQDSSQGDEQPQSAKGENGTNEDADGQPQSAAPDGEDSEAAAQREREQQEAKRDVDPQPDSEADSQERTSAQHAERKLAQESRTEEEQALQQWLRQVPDDPGGLLRRKFMLEHLRRQKERQ